MGFEPTRGDPNGLAVHRLNHSATSSCHNYILKSMPFVGDNNAKEVYFIALVSFLKLKIVFFFHSLFIPLNSSSLHLLFHLSCRRISYQT